MAEDTEMNYFAKFSLDNSNFLSGMTGMAISFDAIKMAAEQSFKLIQQGYEQTVGFAINYQKTIEDIADTNGTSLENAQRWRNAVIATGGDVNEASSALRTMTQRLTESGTAGEELRKKISDMGVDVKDVNGKYRDMSEVMLDVNSAISSQTSGAELSALAFEIYGRNARYANDMITDATEAQTAFHNGKVISDKTLDDIEEFDKRVGIISEKFDNAKVSVGLFVTSFIKDNALLTDSWKGTALGKLFGWDKDTVIMGGVLGAEVNQPMQEAAKVTGVLKDEFKGLRAEELELKLASQDVIAAQKEVNEYTGDSQEEYSKLTLRLAEATLKYDGIRRAMAAVATQAAAMNKTLGSSWSGESVVGEAGSEMQLFLQKEMDAGVDYQTAMQNWQNSSPTAAPGKNTVAGQGMSPAKKESVETINAAKATSDGLLQEFVKQEDYTKVHWTATTEMMRISLTDMAANWKKYVDFAAAYPTIHNVGLVVWDKEGPDWTPESNPIFMQSARRASMASQDLAFTASNFSQVETNASKQQTAVNLTIINEKNVSSKVIEENSKAMASNVSVRGGT